MIVNSACFLTRNRATRAKTRNQARHLDDYRASRPRPPRTVNDVGAGPFRGPPAPPPGSRSSPRRTAGIRRPSRRRRSGGRRPGRAA
ncbi:hypothetical protein ACFFX0_21535 [Citricoccus parietis]|uniref:Uncharacterized protein n=1 Tax=Citricoccus parietis TaxID=592307 RepID=A0ABV5G3W4_9MICC